VNDQALARLFAVEKPDDDNEAFVAAVRRRVIRQRLRAKVVEVGLSAAAVLSGGAVVAFAPEVPLYPVLAVHGLLSSPLVLGAGACALGAAALTWGVRFVDA
jgi:hypothetical protein